MKWETKKVVDVCDLAYGKSLTADTRIPGDYPVYGSAGEVGSHIGYLVEAPGVIIGRKGSVGTVYFEKRNFFPIDTAYYVIPKDDYDIRFLYYKFQTLGLEKLNSDAAVPGLNRNIAYEQASIYPPLPTQRKIAGILSAYDDLIENNLKRIKLLEEKAMLRYKQIVREEKLEFKKAVEVLDFTTGKLNSNASVPNGLYPFFTCGQEVLRTNTYSMDAEAVLLGGNNASAIYPVFYYNGKFDAYQRTYIIRPKSDFKISFKYLYFFWESKLDYLRNISTGAATKFLTLKILNDIEIPIPSRKVMQEYEELTSPIFRLKSLLADQNTKLREAREILLPRLMNGEIEV